MGRKKKFGEESDFVSVRVPKSKRKEYRNGIKHFVEEKFAQDLIKNEKHLKVDKKINSSDGFRKFEELVNQNENKKEGN